MAALEQRPAQGGGRMEHLTEQVFGIDLVREKILNHAIREDNGQVCGSSVCSLRLVQKSWLETITKLLQKSKEPLFKLVLLGGYGPTDDFDGDTAILEQFLFAITRQPSVPTFSIVIFGHVFSENNYDNLSTLLVRCGAGLVELEMDFPRDMGALKLVFPAFSLPILRRLMINLPSTNEDNRDRCDDNVSHFTNCLLNAAPELTEFAVPAGGSDDFERMSLCYRFFTLPPSITALKLFCDMTSANLQLLIKSNLPQLTSLELGILKDNAYPDGSLFRILDNFRSTLRSFTLLGKLHTTWGPPRSVTNLRFPVMENLQEFTNVSINCRLEPEITSLDSLLPNVNRLTLTDHTADMSRKWIQNSKMTTVTELKLHMVNENFRYDRWEYKVGVDLETMQSVRVAYPNIVKLEVSVNAANACGLKYLFTEMRQLTDLTIVVVGSSVGFGQDFWDGLLIGAPVKFVAGLRAAPDFWEGFQFTNDRPPSIKNLRELKSLSLKADAYLHVDQSRRISLISNLAFHFALLKMPKLTSLTLFGMFHASFEMAQVWRSQGRRILNSLF